MLGSETGGSGRAGKFWKGWDGGEQGAEQHLSGLAPAYIENDVGEAIDRNDSSLGKEVCSQQDSSRFIYEFWCCSGAAWGHLLPSVSRDGKRRYPLGKAPCFHEEMSPCIFRPALQDRWVQESGAFLRSPNQQVLPLLLPPPKRLGTSLARRPQLRKQVLYLNCRRIQHKAPAQNLLMSSDNC